MFLTRKRIHFSMAFCQAVHGKKRAASVGHSPHVVWLSLRLQAHDERNHQAGNHQNRQDDCADADHSRLTRLLVRLLFWSIVGQWEHLNFYLKFADDRLISILHRPIVDLLRFCTDRLSTYFRLIKGRN